MPMFSYDKFKKNMATFKKENRGINKGILVK